MNAHNYPFQRKQRPGHIARSNRRRGISFPTERPLFEEVARFVFIYQVLISLIHVTARMTWKVAGEGIEGI
jgi:hypothetical protein